MYIRILIFVCIFLFSSLAMSKPDCKRHKIYCKILKLKPKIDKKWAMKFSNSLYRHSRKNKTDPDISLAMAMQESGFRDIDRKQSIIQFYEKCDKDNLCVTKYRIVRGYSDLSLYQFHVNTIEIYEIDPIRLKGDIEYVIEWHVKILKNKMEICKDLGKESWSCYHSKTPKYRKKYVDDVGRYLKILQVNNL